MTLTAAQRPEPSGRWLARCQSMPADNPTPSRPRMAAIYAIGTVRARRWHGEGDVRGYRSPSGRTARAVLTDIHPMTGHALAACRVVDHRDEGITGISQDATPIGMARMALPHVF